MLNVLCYLKIRGQYFIKMPCENCAKYREFQSVNTLVASFWTNWEDNNYLKDIFDIPAEYLMDLWHHFKYHRMASKVRPTNQTQTEPQAPKVMNQSLFLMLKHPLPVQFDFFPCLGSGKFESCLGGVRIWTKSVRPFQQNTPVSSFKMEVFIGKACTFARTWLRRKGLLESQGSWSYLLQKDWPSNLVIGYSIWMKFSPRGYEQTSLQKFRCPGGKGGGGGGEGGGGKGCQSFKLIGA